jgi:ectoine hydroxylase-related dioxygenase (phytanoyl-CoA dioxygenase family)
MNIPKFNAEPSKVQQWLAGSSLESVCEQFDRDGYYVFDEVLSASEVDALRKELRPYLEQEVAGRNDFEGANSNRIYGMLNKSPLFADLVTHPLALGFAEAEFGKSVLLSACLAIQLNPGETVQPWHFDDSHLEIPRPRAAYGLSTFWALDETTEINGATEIIPGSHTWDGEFIEGALDRSDMNKTHSAIDNDGQVQAVKATMKAGSFMIAKGTLWHRGGANNSDKSRLIITPQYCPGWARPLENMLLAVSRENAAKLSSRAQELIGYNIHPPFMGYVDGMHPRRIFES